MISICLPLYNFDSRNLILALQRQIEQQGLLANILLIDDASASQYQAYWPGLCNHFTSLLQLPKNIGRSQIRNLFFAQAKAQSYLLFLDADSGLVDDDFIQNYVKAIVQNPHTEVFYGGRKVRPEIPQQAKMLKWKYGQEREYKTVILRQQKPYLHFQSNNFLIKKSALVQCSFNKHFSAYGYEDVDFAINLQKNKWPILHINNPVWNEDMEEAAAFLQKLKQSMFSLDLLSQIQPDVLVKQNVKLLKIASKIKKYKLVFVLNAAAFMVKRKLENYLCQSKNPKLIWLDLYKLFLCFEVRI
jgi:glycosyltransferase involved in cell wall biosynthesis